MQSNSFYEFSAESNIGPVPDPVVLLDCLLARSPWMKVLINNVSISRQKAGLNGRVKNSIDEFVRSQERNRVIFLVLTTARSWATQSTPDWRNVEYSDHK